MSSSVASIRSVSSSPSSISSIASAGSGEPVVLLHSGGMSSRQWRRLMDRLAAGYRVLAPDFIGSGDNPPWPQGEPFHFDMDVAAVEAIVRDLARPIHLVGHSYGGFIAATLARKNPDIIRSLTLFDPVAMGVLHDAEDPEGLANLGTVDGEDAFNDPALGGGDAWMEQFVDYWNGPGSWRALPATTRDAFLRVGKKVFYEVTTLLRDRTPCAAYGGVKAPALLLTGESSPIAARRVVHLLSESLPDATAHTIAGAGHMAPITHAGAVNDLIVQHIERAAGAA
ncbi:alpha/beta fold hydrolase [Pendulispora albinea]|uniref:Alpha/beta hydrolase n=1 Tax=Pendulispora albinea TaxID=2741071 RepID=A0ABZ2M3J5_9BACT